MSHPSRFDPDDPLLARVRQLALAFPGAAEKVSHGHPNFFTTKVFAYYGFRAKSDHSNPDTFQTVAIKPDPEERLALLEEGWFAPSYIGPSGWVACDLKTDPDWELIAELLDMSYRNTAPKRLIAQLDASV
ncbi:MmcQ/YjbR family DNA-binding protein [Demetria terragena]|uniref:MmcQ/YjbR family DNA-binding protein n=1 Tax=Demetria terragena TaxID=63959 RepID=UPI000361E36A|nr:MmcQ/YjbR family DNA-binding protein [Demetria terragena]